jgi:SAM-dependent methyltransferase
MAYTSRSLVNDTFLKSVKSGVIRNDNISFNLIRQSCGQDAGVWDELDRGRAILQSNAQLDQYLYSYGPMTRDFWSLLLPEVKLPAGRLEVVDYGCGQGLAFALLCDAFGSDLRRRIGRVILVEPSKTALQRAAAVAACYTGEIPIKTVNKDFDAVGAEDIQTSDNATTLHIFSNVLDIDSFDYARLAELILNRQGNHLVLAVSHDRCFNGGTQRIYGFEQSARDVARRSACRSTVNKVTCPRGKSAICMQLAVEA